MQKMTARGFSVVSRLVRLRQASFADFRSCVSTCIFIISERAFAVALCPSQSVLGIS